MIVEPPPRVTKDDERIYRCRFRAYQAEYMSMEQQSASVRKTFKYKLKPTPAQERALESVLWHSRTLCNAALEQRPSVVGPRTGHKRHLLSAKGGIAGPEGSVSRIR
jgi:Helix-turn-helix domain